MARFLFQGVHHGSIRRLHLFADLSSSNVHCTVVNSFPSVTMIALFRAVCVIVIIFLVWIAGVDSAKSQSYPNCNALVPNAACQYEAQALAAVNAYLNNYASNNPATVKNSRICYAHTPGQKRGMWLNNGIQCASGYYGYGVANATRTYVATCPPGQVPNEFSGVCQPSCDGRPNKTYNPSQIFRSGAVGCIDGCDALLHNNGDGTATARFLINTCSVLPSDTGCGSYGGGAYFNSHNLTCEPPPESCSSGQTRNAATGTCEDSCPAGMVLGQDGACAPDGNECPAGQVKSPAGGCLPGEGQCASGETRGPDGTCKRDGDGDGEPDEGEVEGTTEEKFSGGDDCNSPPSCSGSPIQCGQARIQWRIDCNTRKNRNISGGTCSTIPVCTGEKCDAMEYSSLLFQWRTACALEKLSDSGSGTGDGDQPAWTKVTGMSQDPGEGAVSGDEPILRERSFSTSDINTSGVVGGGGSCPALNASGSGVLSAHVAASANDLGPAWCQWIAGLYTLFLLFGAISSLTIMLKGW